MKGQRRTKEQQLQTDIESNAVKKGGAENKDNFEKKETSVASQYLK